MRSSRFLFLAVCPLLSCGGKVIFDTSATGTGGAGGAPSTTNVSGSTSPATVGVVSTGIGTSVVGTSVVGTAVASTVTTGAGTCKDPGAPMGSMYGIADCNGMPCGNSPCAQVCSAIYDCGRAFCGSPSEQLCPGFPDNPINHDSFVMGSMGACVQQCQQMPAIKQIINPSDCAGTISILKNVSPQFANVCQGVLGGP